MSRRSSFRTRKKQNKMELILVATVVIMLVAVVSIRSIDLKSKRDYYQTRQEQLNQEIAVEQNRKEELEQLRKYTQTKAYVEEVAKDKLGLVYPDEILFQTTN